MQFNDFTECLDYLKHQILSDPGLSSEPLIDFQSFESDHLTSADIAKKRFALFSTLMHNKFRVPWTVTMGYDQYFVRGHDYDCLELLK